MGLEEIRRLKEEAGKPKPPKKYTIPKKSAKKIAAEKEEKQTRGGGDTELVKWYKSRMKFMSDECDECGQKVETRIYQYAINHIAHLLPKRDSMCPSVATHPLNFITLCTHHHDQYDKSNWGEIEKMGCFPEIRDRLIMVYEELAPSERRHFPDSVLKYMKEREFPND